MRLADDAVRPLWRCACGREVPRWPGDRTDHPHQPGRYAGPLTKLSDPKPLPAPVDRHLARQADHLRLTVPQLKLLRRIARKALERPDGRTRGVLDALTERKLAQNKGYARYVLTDAGRGALAEPVPESPTWLSRTGTTTRPADAIYYRLPDGTGTLEIVQDVDELDPGHARRATVRHEEAPRGAQPWDVRPAKPTHRRRAA